MNLHKFFIHIKVLLCDNYSYVYRQYTKFSENYCVDSYSFIMIVSSKAKLLQQIQELTTVKNDLTSEVRIPSVATSI